MGLSNDHSGLVTQVVQALNYYGCIAWKSNTGAARYEGAGGSRFVQFGIAGCADILGLLPGGRFMAVEIKLGKDRIRPQQQDFLDAVDAHQGLAIVLRFPADAIADVYPEVRDMLREEGVRC
jgi:hypothetical protein